MENNEVRITFLGNAADAIRSGDEIKLSLKTISVQAEKTQSALKDVKLSEKNAAETAASATIMKREIKDVGDKADGATAKLSALRLSLLGLAVAGVGVFGPATGAGLLASLAALPALAGGAAGVVGTLALAFHGMGNAIQGDKKAFDALTPSAQAFVQTLRGLGAGLGKDLRNIAQTVLPALTAALKSAFSPTLVSALESTVSTFVRVIGQAAQAWGNFFGSQAFATQFRTIMSEGATLFAHLSSAGILLADALGRVGVAAAPLVTWLGELAVKGAAWLDTAAKSAEQNGHLADGMTTLQDALAAVGRLLGGLLNALGQLGRDLLPASVRATNGLAQALNNLGGWLQKNRQFVSDVAMALANLLNAALRSPASSRRSSSARSSCSATRSAAPKNAVYALIGAFAAFKITQLVLGMQALGTALKVVNAEAAAGTVITWTKAVGGGLLAVETAASTATVEVLTLRGALLSLGTSGVLAALAAAAAGVYALYESVTTQTYPGARPSGQGANSTSSGSILYTRGGITYEAFPGSKPGQGKPFTGTASDGTVYKNGKVVGQTSRPGSSSAANDSPQRAGRQAPDKGTTVLVPNSEAAALAGGGLLQGAHHTDGFPGSGKTAVDIAARVGQSVLAPEDGEVTRDSGSAPKSGSNNINGYSLYYAGDSGTDYFMTHMSWVARPGRYKQGDKIGVIAAGTQGGPHLHVDYAPPYNMMHGKSATNPAGTPGPWTKNTGVTKPSIAKSSAISAAVATLTGERSDISGLGIKKIATELGSQASEIGKELAAKVITTEHLAMIRQKMAKLRQEIADGIRQTKDLVAANKLEKDVGEAIADGLIPPAVGKQIESRLNELEAKLRSGLLSDAARKKVEAQIAALKDSFQGGLKQMLDVKEFDKAINDFLAGLQGLTPKVDAELKRLGIVATSLITPAQMASLEKQADSLKHTLLTKLLSDADRQKLEGQLDAVRESIKTGIQGWVDTVKADQQAFEDAWKDFGSEIESTFQSEVVDKFRNMLDDANDALNVGMNAADAEIALAKYNAALKLGLDEGGTIVRNAVDAVIAADQEYTDALESQDKDRIARAIKAKISATETLKTLDASGYSEQARNLLTAGQALIAATEQVGADRLAADQAAWEKQKKAALAKVDEVVQEVGTAARERHDHLGDGDRPDPAGAHRQRTGRSPTPRSSSRATRRRRWGGWRSRSSDGSGRSEAGCRNARPGASTVLAGAAGQGGRRTERQRQQRAGALRARSIALGGASDQEARTDGGRQIDSRSPSTASVPASSGGADTSTPVPPSRSARRPRRASRTTAAIHRRAE
jgi:hypothetical protein